MAPQNTMYCFLVAIVRRFVAIDFENPTGGVSVLAPDMVTAAKMAYEKAAYRYPVRPGEVVQLCFGNNWRFNARVLKLERRWEEEHRAFVELMEAGHGEAH